MNQKHGYKGTKVYKAWKGARARCRVRSNYGGRGIKFCKRWDNFLLFLKDMGEPPTKAHTLERINNDKGYSPTNCKWATWAEQRNNQQRSRKVEYQGRTQTIGQWSKELSIPYMTLWNRWKKKGNIT